jgi:hypothetical protein
VANHYVMLPEASACSRTVRSENPRAAVLAVREGGSPWHLSIAVFEILIIGNPLNCRRYDTLSE